MTVPSSRPIPFTTAALRVFDLSLGQMLWSRRTVFMALVVGGPVFIALIVRLILLLDLPTAIQPTGATIFGTMIWGLYVRFAIPVLAVFYGTSLMADEIEDRTITYLFTRPVRRGSVLLGKYLAYLACTGMVVLPSVMLVYLLMVPIKGAGLAGSFPALVKDLGILLLGLAVYGALFTLVGAWFRRPVLTGLVFLFGWEQAAQIFPGAFKKFTVAHYLQALVPHAMPQEGLTSLLQGIFRDAPSIPSAMATLALIAAVSLWLAMRIVERKEYVLEQ
jgi:ABC-type transport system involved in multi-copper enzyme maturation permease subunit